MQRPNHWPTTLGIILAMGVGLAAGFAVGKEYGREEAVDKAFATFCRSGDNGRMSDILRWEPVHDFPVPRIIAKAKTMGWNGPEPTTPEGYDVLADWLEEHSKPSLALMLRAQAEMDTP